MEQGHCQKTADKEEDHELCFGEAMVWTAAIGGGTLKVEETGLEWGHQSISRKQ